MLKKAALIFAVALASTIHASVNTELSPFRAKVIERSIELASKEVCPVGSACDDDISRPRQGVKSIKLAVKKGPSCPRPPKKGSRA